MKRKLWIVFVVVALLSSLFSVSPSWAIIPEQAPEQHSGPPPVLPTPDKPIVLPGPQADDYAYPIDEPNPEAEAKLLQRERLLNSGQTAEAASLAITGTDRILVIMVEFGGTDVFTWTAPITPGVPSSGSTWDPLGRADTNEAVVNPANGNTVLGDCSKIITQTTVFTYTGPLHNEIPRPTSAADRSGDSVWTEDFSAQWFNNFLFGAGITFNYTRTDGSLVNLDYTGKSFTNYYKDMSGGVYTATGDVIGWLPVQHSTMWYGSDQCPGARSYVGTSQPGYAGSIPGAGSNASLVRDALDAVNAISNTLIVTDSQGVGHPFNWADYDTNGDGRIDRLWIVHSGYGEEDGIPLLNRTPYGESAMWSHSSSISTYSVTQQIAARAYIMMPENGGISVFAHESAHNIGAGDLYDTQYAGNSSAGMWTLMSDSWTGAPIGYEPQALDPLHLDLFGWLNPLVITDTSQVYTVTLGQASAFPGGDNVYRGAKIALPLKPTVYPWQGKNYWWGGKQNSVTSTMTTRNPINLAGATTASLTFDTAYYMQNNRDYMQIQVSTDGGGSWVPITNTHTSTTLKGFTNQNSGWPRQVTEVFDLTPYAGQNILLRFAYITDASTTNDGPFVDNVKVATDVTPSLFFDDAESGDANWTYQAPWVRTTAVATIAQNLYLQWRNVSGNGGYDETLAQTTWRYGPANTGLVVWYNDTAYSNNNFNSYVARGPSWGVKGRMLVLDSHPDPYRDPYYVAMGYDNEGGDLPTRSLMRDAPFSLNPTVNFTFTAANGAYTDTQFFGRPAVSVFHDSMGYYPGAEYVSRGPGYPLTDTLRWVAKQWDASVVAPASGLYPVKAPGYIGTGGTPDHEWYYRCTKTLTDGTLYCPGFSAGLGYDGGTGNPGDYGVQYGWHVQILSQAANGTTATLKIWNAQREADQAFFPDKTTAGVGQTIQYTYVLTQNWGSALGLFACAPIDTSKVTYVAGSVTNGAIPLPIPCSAAKAVLESGKARSMADIAAATAGVQAIGWTGNVGTGLGTGFSFQVTPIAVGPIDTGVILYDQNAYWKTLSASRVTVQPIADFTASATDVATNQVITFTNTSTGTPPLSYVWDFGDSTATVTDTNPTHAYTAAGSYTVTLTVTNTDGSDSKQLGITVVAPDLWVQKTGPATARVGDIVTYTITFGNNTASAANNAWITDTVLAGTTPITQFVIPLGTVPPAPFSTTLVYTLPVLPIYAGITFTNQVNINTTDADGDPTNDAAMTQTFVGFPPVAAFAPSAMTAKVNTAIDFTNASVGTPPLTYLWNLGDGSAVTTTMNVTHVYTRSGVFTVTLTASSIWGLDSTYWVAVTITPYTTFLPIITRN